MEKLQYLIHAFDAYNLATSVQDWEWEFQVTGTSHSHQQCQMKRDESLKSKTRSDRWKSRPPPARRRGGRGGCTSRRLSLPISKTSTAHQRNSRNFRENRPAHTDQAQGAPYSDLPIRRSAPEQGRPDPRRLSAVSSLGPVPPAAVAPPPSAPVRPSRPAATPGRTPRSARRYRLALNRRAGIGPALRQSAAAKQ